MAMKAWRDGMGRVTVKYPTGELSRGSVLTDGHVVGVVRALGWLIVTGPASANVIFDGQLSDTWRRHKARKHWMQRHGPKELRSHGWTAEQRAALLVDEDWD